VSRTAQVHTQLNLDARFAHIGKGYWGLKDWAPKTAKIPAINVPSDRHYQPKPDDYLPDEEETIDDESELLIPVEEAEDLDSVEPALDSPAEIVPDEDDDADEPWE
ncbi:MAG: hypothetical protein Q8N36_02520, partial [bacterium]|nr:hypothetical protein [bacterium]